MPCPITQKDELLFKARLFDVIYNVLVALTKHPEPCIALSITLPRPTVAYSPSVPDSESSAQNSRSTALTPDNHSSSPLSLQLID